MAITMLHTVYQCPEDLDMRGARTASMDHKAESGDRKPEPILLLFSCLGVSDSL